MKVNKIMAAIVLLGTWFFNSGCEDNPISELSGDENYELNLRVFNDLAAWPGQILTITATDSIYYESPEFKIRKRFDEEDKSALLYFLQRHRFFSLDEGYVSGGMMADKTYDISYESASKTKMIIADRALVPDELKQIIEYLEDIITDLENSAS